jgi:hypothetical protein
MNNIRQNKNENFSDDNKKFSLIFTFKAEQKNILNKFNIKINI